MAHQRLRKALSVLISLVLVSAFALPTAAFAAKPEVQVDNHSAAEGQKVLTKIHIDGVDAPQPGAALDSTAKVTSAEGEAWEIPVLWIGNDLRVATEAVEGKTYLPALVFFMPQGCTAEGGAFTVTLSDSLTKLFGNEDVVSVYDASRGITYILPASLKNFFAAAQAQAQEQAASQENQEAEPADEQQDEATEPAENEAKPAEEETQKTLAEIYCAQTALSEFSDEDLEWLIKLVKDILEPQAVNLLIKQFPAFSDAAANKGLSTDIGLYIYHKKGDKDGIDEHESASEALAFVGGDTFKKDGVLRYGLLIGVDVDDLVVKDANGDPVRNQAGKLTLLRSGNPLVTLNNTIVHELFHAFTDDYNRTGMLGARSVQEGYTPGGNFTSAEQKRIFDALRFPKWFTEGCASAVENVYQFRYGIFQMYRLGTRGGEPVLESTFTHDTLINNYLNGKVAGQNLYFDLENASSAQKGTQARYVTGYLATLYLSQLAAQKDPAIGSAKNDDGTFSSTRIRMGLNSILERLHKGETLDAVIKDISTVGSDAPMYTSTHDFETKFIKGPDKGGKTYDGDSASTAFTLDFLNYMLAIDKTPGRNFKPNGSILFEFDDDFNLPLDPNKQATADYYRIAESNTYVASTVAEDVAFASGGKSSPTAVAAASVAAASASALPLAAKAEADEPAATETAAASESTANAQDEATQNANAQDAAAPEATSANSDEPQPAEEAAAQDDAATDAATDAAAGDAQDEASSSSAAAAETPNAETASASASAA